MEAKLKHLEFIQAVITRMATNSFLFKGWAITIAAGLAAFAAVESRAALLTIAIASSLLFWGLDGYYLWLERAFRDLHKVVAAKDEAAIDFSMTIDKDDAFYKWLKTCMCSHVLAFYGVILVVEVVGIFLIGAQHGS